MNRIDNLDLICARESKNLYHNENQKILEKCGVFERGHTQFSFGYYEDRPILTFMGTDGTADALDDLKFCKEKEKMKTFLAKFHHGVDEQWDTIKPLVYRILEKENDFIFNGHSLGGGLAQRAAIDYIDKKRFRVNTFGSLRVMDYRTARYYDKSIEMSKRFTYKSDIVPHLPASWMNFSHTKGHIALGKITLLDKISLVKKKEDHCIDNYETEISKALLK